MGQYSSYYLYQKYERRCTACTEADWVPCYPNTYSISGDSASPMTLVEKSSADTACGYIPYSEPQYRWNLVDGYICADCNQTKVIINTTTTDGIYISGSGEIARSEVSGYASAATEVVITSDATSIGNNAFRGFSDVNFVRIPSSITNIGERAFYGCPAMTECQIPYGVLSIGNSAFTNCISLMFVDIPKSVSSLGNACFMGCLNFRYASIPSSISEIPSMCFYNCDGLSDIEIPSSVNYLGSSAFCECSGLYSVTINRITPPNIGRNVFSNANSNLKIYVPCGSIEEYKTKWSEYASKINAMPQSDCSTRWYPSGTTCIGYDKWEESIKQISNDGGVTWTNVVPTEYSATTLLESKSEDCGYIPPVGERKLKAIYNDGSYNRVLCNNNSTLFENEVIKTGYKLSAITSVVIGDCVTSIGTNNYNSGNTFSGCTSLSSVTIPDSVTNIGYGAFRVCTSLSSITIPNSVTSIGQLAFSNCTSLTSIEIPSGVTSIEGNTFYGCTSLTSIEIPSGVTFIGNQAFERCTSLTSITCLRTTPPTLSNSDVFYNTNNCPIYVPSGSVDAYKSASDWSGYASRIRPIT